jgi:hypothetical protein
MFCGETNFIHHFEKCKPEMVWRRVQEPVMGGLQLDNG